MNAGPGAPHADTCDCSICQPTQRTRANYIALRLYEDDVEEIIRLLNDAFVWLETPQGVAYWSDVVKNLKDLIS